MIRTLLLSLILLLASGTVFAQQEITFSNTTKFFVDGTSTLHDWTVESGQVTGKLVVADDNASAIKSVQLSLKVESLQSGKSGMDKRMHDAFDTKKNPNISFESSKVTLNSDKTGGVATGKLTMAGATKEVEIPFTLTSEDGIWKFTGSADLLMTTFEMKPPTAMLGTVRSGDAVTVRFEVLTSQPEFSKAQN